MPRNPADAFGTLFISAIDMHRAVDALMGPALHSRAVVTCKDTGLPVVAEWEGDDWLHLHNESDVIDAAEVEEFLSKGGKRA